MFRNNGQPNNKFINQNIRPNAIINQNAKPNASPNRCGIPISIQTGCPVANKPNNIKGGNSNQFKTLTNHIASHPVSHTNSKTIGQPASHMTGKTTNYTGSHMTSKTNSLTTNQTNKAAAPNKPLCPKKINNPSNVIRDLDRSSRNQNQVNNSKTNNENKLTSTGHKRPLEPDDKLLDLDKSKIRKTLEGIDWNVLIDEDSLEVSEIDQLEDDTIDHLPMDDLDLVRDITDFEFEASMNESINAKVQSIGEFPRDVPLFLIFSFSLKLSFPKPLTILFFFSPFSHSTRSSTNRLLWVAFQR